MMVRKQDGISTVVPVDEVFFPTGDPAAAVMKALGAIDDMDAEQLRAYCRKFLRKAHKLARRSRRINGKRLCIAGQKNRERSSYTLAFHNRRKKGTHARTPTFVVSLSLDDLHRLREQVERLLEQRPPAGSELALEEDGYFDGGRCPDCGSEDVLVEWWDDGESGHRGQWNAVCADCEGEGLDVQFRDVDPRFLAEEGEE
jgi:hypothetical protein